MLEVHGQHSLWPCTCHADVLYFYCVSRLSVKFMSCAGDIVTLRSLLKCLYM